MAVFCLQWTLSEIMVPSDHKLIFTVFGIMLWGLTRRAVTLFMYWCKSHFRICCNYLFRGVNTGRTHPTSTHLSNWLGGWKWNFCDEVFARLDRKYVGCEIRCVSATVAHRCKYRIVREAAVKRTQIEYVWYGSGIIFFESFCISWSKLKYDRVGQSVESALIALAAIFFGS